MQLESFRQWIQQVYATRDEELDCEGFSRLIPQYVDKEIAGESVEHLFPTVKQHLGQCAECADIYATLHDVAFIESQVVQERTELELVLEA